ncbi:MAG: DUF84 family protein [Candidatus Hodarchaeales archaeon]
MQNITILIASKNPVKIKASQEAFQPFFNNVKIDSCEVKLLLRDVDQPIGEEQTREFSRLRVSEARKEKIGYDFYIGIEGGIVKTSAGDVRIVVYSSVGDSNYTETIRGCEIPLPEEWFNALSNKKYGELGDLVEYVSGVQDIKRKQGAVGFFTKENITRYDVLKQSIIMALIPYLNPQLFEK